MDYRVELFQQFEQPVLSIRTRAAVEKLPEILGKAYLEILEYLDEIDELPADAPFVAYFNQDMQDLDIEVGFPVPRELPGKGNIQSSKIPAGEQAVTMHKGAYSGCEGAYNALMTWISENGKIPVGSAYEFYLNDPRDTPEDELLTRIAMPLKG